MLDPIITPRVLLPATYMPPPLDPDPDYDGRPIDHLIVLMRPINMINNKSARTRRTVTARPIRQSGLESLGWWLKQQDWSFVMKETDVDKKKLQIYIRW